MLCCVHVSAWALCQNIAEDALPTSTPTGKNLLLSYHIYELMYSLSAYQSLITETEMRNRIWGIRPLELRCGIRCRTSVPGGYGVTKIYPCNFLLNSTIPTIPYIQLILHSADGALVSDHM